MELELKRKEDLSAGEGRARLCVGRRMQTGGTDCDASYAPVEEFERARMVAGKVGKVELCVHQVEVEGAFLCGEIGREV